MDGTLDYDEFNKLMRMRMEERQKIGAADDIMFREAFKVFDRDNSGKISKDELRLVLNLREYIQYVNKKKLSKENRDFLWEDEVERV